MRHTATRSILKRNASLPTPTLIPDLNPHQVTDGLPSVGTISHGLLEWEIASDVVRFNPPVASDSRTLHLSVAALTASSAAVCYLSSSEFGEGQSSEYSECKVARRTLT